MQVGSLVTCKKPRGFQEEVGWMGLVVELETCKAMGKGFWVCYFDEPSQWRWYRPEDYDVEVLSESS